MIPDLEALYDCAVEAAQAAGNHALEHHHRRDEVTEHYAHDVKLRLDREAQDRAEEVIHRRFPRHQILGEEGRRDADPSQPQWIIDPIDGTMNYFHGLSYWCSSVAVRHRERMLVGAVYAPVVRELYTASAEGPALLNDKPIAVSEVRTLSESLICTGLSKLTTEVDAAYQSMQTLSGKVQKIRILGAAALDICQVAAGRADGYVEYSIFLWDIAAGGLIAERAGARTGIITEFGDYRMRYMCATPHIYDPLKEIYMGADPGPV